MTAPPSDSSDLRQILSSTRIGQLPLTQRPTLSPSDTLADAVAEMKSVSHGSAVVANEGSLVGIITERDILRAVSASGSLEQSVADVMTKDPVTLSSDDTVLEAMRLMHDGGYRRIPVIHTEDSTISVVDVKNVVHVLVEHFPEAVYNQAAHSQLIARHREGA